MYVIRVVPLFGKHIYLCIACIPWLSSRLAAMWLFWFSEVALLNLILCSDSLCKDLQWPVSPCINVCITAVGSRIHVSASQRGKLPPNCVEGDRFFCGESWRFIDPFQWRCLALAAKVGWQIAGFFLDVLSFLCLSFVVDILAVYCDISAF